MMGFEYVSQMEFHIMRAVFLFFFSFAMSTLSMNSASLFAYVGVLVFSCGISGISTDSTLNEMAM